MGHGDVIGVGAGHIVIAIEFSAYILRTGTALELVQSAMKHHPRITIGALGNNAI